jgi:uncharacterized protein YqgC (DUF456 family)
MDIFLYILAGICIIAGIIGCIMPGLPGPPVSYLGIFLLNFTTAIDFSTQYLIITFLLVVIVQILDYYIPIWATKKFGGSKKGVWGSIIGLIAGFLFPPYGIIIGPFAGAVIGELIDGKQTMKALKSGLGSFIGFLLGTAAKFAICFYFAGVFIYKLVA